MSQKGVFREDNTSLWVEKYRPKSLDEYIGNKELKEKVKECIEKQDVPNLLLSGSAGVGKSSVCNLLIKEIDCDFKYINASNESGIDTVRTTIIQFCSSVGFAPLKILFLDEFGTFSVLAQSALKAAIEQYAKHTRFFFTTNTIEQVIEPIRSRCQEYNVSPPSKEEVYDRCKHILKVEKVEYDELELVHTIDFAYPDIRKCIQLLQQQTIDGVLKLNKDFFKLLKYQEDIVGILKKLTADNLFDKVTEIRQLLADSKVKNYIQLYRYLYDKLDDYTKKEKRVRIICHIQEGLKYDSFIADKEINIISTLLRIAEELIS
jgi:DNA polymerase III delta prime subunit